MADTPDTTVYVEPGNTRALLDWTPNLIRAARANADHGNLELAAEFWESALADDRVRSAIATRTNGLVSLPLTFESVRGTKRLVKALEAGEDWWAAFPSSALAQLLAWGIGLGVGVGQLVWTDRGSSINRLVPVLQVWHPRHLRYDWQRRTWTVRVDGLKWIDVTPGDGKWILYMPYGDNRPWAWGVWRAIAAWTLLKQYAIADWGDYSSKSGTGHKVASTPESFSKEKRKEVAAELFAMQAGSSIALPPGVTLDLLEADANTYETFVAQKDAADLGVSVAILGQNLSSEVSGPVSTGATLHGRVMQVYIDADAETLSTCVHDQALVWWAEFNFGSRDLAPWPDWDTKPPADQKQRAEVDKLRAEGASVLAGTGVATVNEVRVAAGLEPLKEGGDELVAKPAPVASPPAADAAKAFPNLGLDRAFYASMIDLVERLVARVERGEQQRDVADTGLAREQARLTAEVDHVAEKTDAALDKHDERIEQVEDAARENSTRVSLLEDRVQEVRSVASELTTGIVALREAQFELERAMRNELPLIVAQELTARAVSDVVVQLASGQLVRVQSGFVQGQLYADAVADAARDRAASVLDPDVVAVLEAIDAGTSYDDIRARLLKTYRGMSPDQLAKLTEAAFTMAELGGRHAINEDL